MKRIAIGTATVVAAEVLYRTKVRAHVRRALGVEA